MADYSTLTAEEEAAGLTRIVQNPVVNAALALTAKDQQADETHRREPVKKGPSMRAQLGINDPQKDRVKLEHGHVIFRSAGLEMCAPVTKQILAYVLLGLSNSLPEKGLTEEEAYKHVVYNLELNHYCTARHVKDKKSAKQTLVKALNALSELTFEYAYTQYEKKSNGRYYPREVIAKGGILTLVQPAKSQRGGYFHQGKCKIVFTGPFVEFMANGGRFYMPFYKALLSINSQYNPYGFQLGHKLQTHRFINDGKPGQDIISVESLMRVCGFNDSTRHPAKEVIDPFERDLDKLQELGVLSKWEYTNAKGEKLRDEQLNFSNFARWKKLYVKFEFNNYPARPRQAHKKAFKKES